MATNKDPIKRKRQANLNVNPATRTLLDNMRSDFGIEARVIKAQVGNYEFGFRIPSGRDIFTARRIVGSELELGQAIMAVCSINDVPLYEVMGINPAQFKLTHVENPDYPPPVLRNAAMSAFATFLQDPQVNPALSLHLNRVFASKVEPILDIAVPTVDGQTTYQCVACDTEELLSRRDVGYFCKLCGSRLVDIAKWNPETNTDTDDMTSPGVADNDPLSKTHI